MTERMAVLPVNMNLTLRTVFLPAIFEIHAFT